MKKLPLLLTLLLLLASCSTKNNTGLTRFWHSFTARYNTYYNGSVAFKEARRQQIEGNKDNYTEMLPVFDVTNKSTQGIGKGGYETSITKCQKAIQLHSIQKKPQAKAGDKNNPKRKLYLQRQEYNPFLKNAWLMMGQAQYYKGEFLEAASTFAYITRHYAAEPRVAAEARAWQARCYAQMDWFYDAEECLRRMGRDSLTVRTARQRDASTAELLVRQQRYAEALPYLKRMVKYVPGSLPKARLYYLMGQIYQQLGDSRQAYRAYGKVIGKNPPFELEFNARIQQTEVLSAEASQRKKMISRLRRMAHNDKYKNYLDQVYFALGNIHLARRDTLQAIEAYETGRSKATRSGVEKGVLCLKLGEVYWDRRRFDKAQPCYTEALSLLSKERKGYDEIMRRSKVLDKLVPYTSAVHLQDSLQELSLMSEKDRNAAIDRLIAMEKRRQEEERKAKRDSAAQARAAENGDDGDMPNAGGKQNRDNTQKGDDKAWYFYNPMMVIQGKQSFQKQWGQRKNEDNWRRSNRTVLAAADDNFSEDEMTEEMRDSIDRAEALADSIAEAEAANLENPENNPLKREYYLKDIPFTPEAKEASNLIIMDGLHHAGVIEKDDLGDLPLASETLERIVRQYPTYSQMQDVYYQLFLLYLRWHRDGEADHYRQLMAQYYPESDTTRVITNPRFEYNARHGRRIEDSLYTATYEAFRLHDYETVAANVETSTAEFPDGINRPKFLFLSALTRLGTDDKAVAKELRTLVQKFPDSDVSTMAGMIAKGLEAGRKTGSGGYDLGSLWTRRSADATNAGDSLRASGKLSDDRNASFVFVVAYPTDSLDDNQLLYNLAQFNFNTFTVRNFTIEKVSGGGLTQFRVKGFANFNEVHHYAQRIYVDPTLSQPLQSAHTFLISEPNLALIGAGYSFADYMDFYEKHFAPMEIDPSLPLDEEPDIEQHYEDEYEDQKPANVPANDDDYGGEWY